MLASRAFVGRRVRAFTRRGGTFGTWPGHARDGRGRRVAHPADKKTLIWTNAPSVQVRLRGAREPRAEAVHRRSDKAAKSAATVARHTRHQSLFDAPPRNGANSRSYSEASWRKLSEHNRPKAPRIRGVVSECAAESAR